jgi:hypothetical protein
VRHDRAKSETPESRQKAARATPDALFAESFNVRVIHYSCESFDGPPAGRSKRITSIAVRNLASEQTRSFSIHQEAELQGLNAAQTDSEYDDLERAMLKAFYEHVVAHSGAKYLHWNMRDTACGFADIEHRYRALNSLSRLGERPAAEPVVIDDNRKVDLSRLLIDIYGDGYAGHPRIDSLMTKNEKKPLALMTGKEEAKAFLEGNYVGLHRSTLLKVGVLSNFATLAHDRQLKTDTSWRDMHGGGITAAGRWVIRDHLIAFILAVVALVIGILSLYLDVWPKT